MSDGKSIIKIATVMLVAMIGIFIALVGGVCTICSKAVTEVQEMKKDGGIKKELNDLWKGEQTDDIKNN